MLQSAMEVGLKNGHAPRGGGIKPFFRSESAVGRSGGGPFQSVDATLFVPSASSPPSLLSLSRWFCPRPGNGDLLSSPPHSSPREHAVA